MAKSFTLVQLRYFTVVARRENMRAAAHELNVTQSTLSAAIHQLEREMGAELFQRLSSRGLRLTGEGRRLLVGARTFLEDADQLYHSVRAEREELVGDLVVGIFSPIAPFHAPNILTALEQRHPRINVSFLEGDQETLMRALAEGTCEVAVMYDLGVGTEFGYRVLERIPPHILVSAEHPRAARPEIPVHLRELEDEPFILLDLKHSRDTSPPAIMYVFMPGVAIALIEPLLAVRLRDRPEPARKIAWAAFAFAALAAVVYTVTDYDPRETPIHHVLGQRALLAALCTGALILGLLVLQLGTSSAPRLFANRVMLWMGERSYSFYLVHIWVLLEIDHALGDGESLTTRVLIMVAVALPLTTAIAALSYRYVERPFLERKRKVVAGGGKDGPDGSGVPPDAHSLPLPARA